MPFCAFPLLGAFSFASGSADGEELGDVLREPEFRFACPWDTERNGDDLLAGEDGRKGPLRGGEARVGVGVGVAVEARGDEERIAGLALCCGVAV